MPKYKNPSDFRQRILEEKEELKRERERIDKEKRELAQQFAEMHRPEQAVYSTSTTRSYVPARTGGGVPQRLSNLFAVISGGIVGGAAGYGTVYNWASSILDPSWQYAQSTIANNAVSGAMMGAVYGALIFFTLKVYLLGDK